MVRNFRFIPLLSATVAHKLPTHSSGSAAVRRGEREEKQDGKNGKGIISGLTFNIRLKLLNAFPARRSWKETRSRSSQPAIKRLSKVLDTGKQREKERQRGRWREREEKGKVEERDRVRQRNEANDNGGDTMSCCCYCNCCI